jgi:hypothetical protein
VEEMKILIMSEPDGSLADLLLKSGVSTLICVTQDDVHLRSDSKSVVSGGNIHCPQQIEIDVPEIKAQLLKAYPLIDRWVSSKQSISTSIGLLLDYTVSLIQIIGNHSPRVAVLETGAPHHLFTYCLDIALNYLNIKIYYLYGNAFDSRCVVFEGNEKKAVVHTSDYSAERTINDYVNSVQRSATYTPEDSLQSLAPLLHKSSLYVMYLHLRYIVAKFRHGLRRPRLRSDLTQINLRLPYFGLFEVNSIMNEQRKYLKILKASDIFQQGQIQSTDIVYVGHMLPEATSFPESPDYPDEIDILIDLKNRFPESKIYYREHPAIEIFSEFGHVHFQGLHKCPAFYQQLMNLGIGVVPASIHISNIRNTGCLFATKTGRVAVENSILGIPTIIYGFPFYGISLPLASHVSKLHFYPTVQHIKDRAASISDPVDAVKKYLIAMFSGSIENPGISVRADPNARLTFETNFVQVVNHLCVANNTPRILGEIS